MKGFPTSADIYLELDGRKIAVVQSYRAKAAKSSKNIEAFGESEPVATIEGQKSYTVELTRLYATDTVSYTHLRICDNSFIPLPSAPVPARPTSD